MKKLITLILTLALGLTAIFGLTACGKKNYTKAQDQLTALTEVKAGTSDIAVIDSVMANYYVNKENFSDLQILTGKDFTFENEFYSIGFRKDTNTASYINYALYCLQEEGVIEEIAKKYGLQDALNTIAETEMPGEPEKDSDIAKIVASGEFKLGYTLFEPIAYEDSNGKLVGFDIELAEAVCSLFEVELKPIKINWDTKEDELNNGSIDCIWNGFTYTDDRAKNLDFSAFYMKNTQAIVIRKADAEKYTSYKAMKGAKFTAESESAGESTINDIIFDKIG